MQNRYVGDIGDYGKIGLLRVLQETGCSIGVNWYLTPNETHNADGKHTEYLRQDIFRKADPFLFDSLKEIVFNEHREVLSIQQANLLKSKYYSEILDFSNHNKNERMMIRKKWHDKALSALSDVDIIFVDPDNGIITPSSAETQKSNKFVLVSELADYYNAGTTVIYYQHKARKPDSFYIEQHISLLSDKRLNNASGLLLKFKKTSQRYYGFIIQPKHDKIIKDAVNRLLESSWNDYFGII